MFPVCCGVPTQFANWYDSTAFRRLIKFEATAKARDRHHVAETSEFASPRQRATMSGQGIPAMSARLSCRSFAACAAGFTAATTTAADRKQPVIDMDINVKTPDGICDA